MVALGNGVLVLVGLTVKVALGSIVAVELGIGEDVGVGVAHAAIPEALTSTCSLL